MSNEDFYDTEIAPTLKRISEQCAERDMAFVASVEYEPGEIGRTLHMGPSASLAMVMLRHCQKMGVNVDGYFFGLRGYMKDKGLDYGASIVMCLLDHEGAKKGS